MIISEAVAIFTETCLQNAGDRVKVVEALAQTGGFSVSGADSATTIAPHSSKNLGLLVMGEGAGSHCIVKFEPPNFSVEAFYETVSVLADVMGVSKDEFSETAAGSVYDLPTALVQVRIGSGIQIIHTLK